MQSTVSLHILIRQGITWSALEGILFQTILVVHNLFLFKTIPLELYGATGMLFSLAYGIAYCMSAGFELFYSDTKIEPAPRAALFWIQTAWIMVCFMILVIIRHVVYINPLVIILALSEALKRSLKVITFASHHFATVTTYELAHLITYSLTIWLLYYSGYTLTQNLIIIPLILTTLGCIGSYLYRLTIPRQLPNQFWQLLQQRVTLSGGTIYHILFSGNVLTPLAYYTLGPVYASGIKLASTCTHGILSIIEKVLTMNIALLGSSDDHASLYKDFGTYIWQAVYSGISITILLLSYTFWSSDTLFLLPYALLYLILHSAGLISIVCERILCAESPKKSPYLLIYSLFGCIVTYLVNKHIGYPVLAIVLFICTRISLSFSLGLRISRHKAPDYFNHTKQHLLALFAFLILCVFFMRV